MPVRATLRQQSVELLSRQRLSCSHFTRTADIVQESCRLHGRPCSSKTAINRLDRYDLLILDDLSYVHKDHAETSVLFELIGARS